MVCFSLLLLLCMFSVVKILIYMTQSEPVSLLKIITLHSYQVRPQVADVMKKCLNPSLLVVLCQ